MRQVNGVAVASAACEARAAIISDVDLLSLQDMFLTPGFHRVRVDALSLGLIRSFLAGFIKSFSCFSVMGYLASNSSNPSLVAQHESFCFLDQDAMRYSQSALSPDAIDRFVLENFYYDCVLVECTSQAKVCDWFVYFCNRIRDFNLFASVPIVMLDIQDS